MQHRPLEEVSLCRNVFLIYSSFFYRMSHMTIALVWWNDNYPKMEILGCKLHKLFRKTASAICLKHKNCTLFVLKITKHGTKHLDHCFRLCFKSEFSLFWHFSFIAGDWVMLIYKNGEAYDGHCSKETRRAIIMISCDTKTEVIKEIQIILRSPELRKKLLGITVALS